MPPGDAWQLLGRSIGANPTPMAYAEVYTGLQTGAIDGQDNPLPNVQNMKFYEVMSQIVLTSHLVGYDLLTVNLKTWNSLSPARQAAFQAAADKAIKWSTAEHLKREAELAEGFKKQGLDVYAPDVERLPRARAEDLPGVRRGEGLAGGHAREDRRDPLMPRHRRLAAPTRRERRRPDAGGDVPGVHRPDRLPLRLQLAGRLDLRAHGHHLAVARALGRGVRA